MIGFKRFTTIVALIAATGTLSAENWPQWRGPGSQGISSEAGLPAEWSRDEEHCVEDSIAGRTLVADRVG